LSSPIGKNVGIAGHTGRRSGIEWEKVDTNIPSAAKENHGLGRDFATC
jgi:hypothetical protein